jgi:hypothetical protein
MLSKFSLELKPLISKRADLLFQLAKLFAFLKGKIRRGENVRLKEN